MSEPSPHHPPQPEKTALSIDGDGLIFAWEIEENGSGHEQNWESVATKWEQPGLLWLHLNFEHPKVIFWLSTESGVDESLLPYLLADDSRPGVFCP